MEYRIQLIPETLNSHLYELKYNGYLAYNENDTVVINTREDIPSYFEEFIEALLVNTKVEFDKSQERIFTDIIQYDVAGHYASSEWPSEDDLYFSDNYIQVDDVTADSFISNTEWQGMFFATNGTLSRENIDIMNLLYGEDRLVIINKESPAPLYVAPIIFDAMEGVSNDIANNRDILHFHGIPDTDGHKYRRTYVNEFLKNAYPNRVDTIELIDRNLLSKIVRNNYKYAFISHPSINISTLNKLKSNKVYIVYDRTDKWNADISKYLATDNWLLENADMIFNSSHKLYEESLSNRSESNTKLITNGTNVIDIDYDNIVKYDTRTAIYVGNYSNKLDFNYLKSLAIENKNWNFKFYGVTGDIRSDIVDLPNVEFLDFIPLEELIPIIAKCHVGLIPFRLSEWTSGMLPLKLFNYINGHIPTLYINCDECKYFPQVAFDGNSYTLNDIYNLSIDSSIYDDILNESKWSNKFDLMKGYLSW